MDKKLIPMPRTKFLKIKCNGCGNEQIVFSAPASTVKCLACNQTLAESTGGKIRPIAKIVKELE
ncbi:MAG: 30S ribosomal protein S27e [Candidatus ainarchaeum sp.]|nr:30S ribosomal protein S27e [Candidatus ainarchaeum sp.]